jgi:AraC-like DNA-binding protein
MRVSRTADHCRQEQSDQLFICRQMAGQLIVEQNGREAPLDAGDMTLLDPRLPYIGQFGSGSKLLVMRVPRRALEARVGATSGMLGRVLGSSETGHSLTSGFLAMIPGLASTAAPVAAETIRTQCLDLIALSLARSTGKNTTSVSSARSIALLNVRAAIEARLSDPLLDVATVAAAAGFSVRYANALLATEGTSIARLICTRRLERCRKALADPLQASRTISEIAFGWGFSDMTHVGRKFKAAYGILPSEYRYLAKERRSGA